MDDNIANIYTYDYAKIYFQRREGGLLRRFANYFEQRMVRRALRMAGSPKKVLDLPCGTGRCIPTLVNNGAKYIIAADQSEGMLRFLKENLTKIDPPIQLIKTSIGKIALPDKCVESTICIRLMHHFNSLEMRKAAYRELRRVSLNTVCISFWIQGNYRSFRENIRCKRKGQPNHCLASYSLEKELEASGFSIIGYVDLLKTFHCWRTYVLKV